MDNFDFMYQPINLIRIATFKDLISKVKGDKVLDLGCGAVGHYWALAYIHQVQYVDMVDCNSEFVDALSEIVNCITPEYLEQNFEDTVEFLKNNQSIPVDQNYYTLAENLVTKINDIKVFDFLKDSLKTKYDIVLAMQSIECVDDENQFLVAINQTANLLELNGIALIQVLRYRSVTDYTQGLIDQKMEGILNPDIIMIQELFGNSKLQIDDIKIINLGETVNHNETIFIQASLR
jgi:hypothetical protein